MNDMELVKQRIIELIQSDITGYRISIDFPNITQPLISNLKNGLTKLDNITLGTAEKLYKAYLYYFEEDIK